MKKPNLIFNFLSIVIIFLLVFSINGCSGDDNLQPNPDPDPDLPVVVVPNTYADNYIPISSWQDRPNGIWQTAMTPQLKNAENIIICIKQMLLMEIFMKNMSISLIGVPRIL